MQHNNAGDRDFSFVICPVPLRQQPIIQYQRLKEKRFFRWAILTHSVYSTKLLAVWVTGVLVCLYAININYPKYGGISVVDLLRCAIVGKLAVLCCLTKLYAAWRYVYLRLINSEIVYKIPTKAVKVTVWQKSQLFMMRDALIARFQVKHILKRMEQTLLSVLLLFGINLVILFLVTNPQFVYR